MNNSIIDQATRTIGVLTTAIGLQRLRNDFSTVEKTTITSKTILDTCNKLGISANELDVNYYTTTFENWQIITSTLYAIVKNFPWTADTFDCDNRAGFVQHLCALITGLNTCSDAFCKITNIVSGATDMHHPNLIIDNLGNAYIFDVDNGGVFQKITANGFIANNWKYNLQGIRIG